MEDRFFFAKDMDSHWYMVPESLRAEWQQMTRNDLDNDEEIDAFNEKFGDYRTGGGISHISFTNPKGN